MPRPHNSISGYLSPPTVRTRPRRLDRLRLHPPVPDAPRPVRRSGIPIPLPVRLACIPLRGRFRQEQLGKSGTVGRGQLLGQRQQGGDDKRGHLLWR